MKAGALIVTVVVLAGAAGDRAAIAQQRPDPVVSLSEADIAKIVGRVRAGRSLQPKSWPNGARVAVLLSFDVDNETLSLRGEGPSIGALSQGEYGARVALGRIVALLDRHQIPASFFVPAISLVLSPDMAGVIKRSGRHEFGIHGWVHESNTTLDYETEKALVVKARAYLEQATGTRPVGYRAPSWNFSPYTLSIVRELGFLYDSSLMADDRPYELLADGKSTGLVELPVEWILDDAPLMNPRGDSYTPPRELLQVYIDEFDKAYEEGTMFLLTTHPPSAHHRASFAYPHPRTIDRSHQGERERLVRHAPTGGRVRQGEGGAVKAGSRVQGPGCGACSILDSLSWTAGPWTPCAQHP